MCKTTLFALLLVESLQVLDLEMDSDVYCSWRRFCEHRRHVMSFEGFRNSLWNCEAGGEVCDLYEARGL
jgi:hypothetical protein